MPQEKQVLGNSKAFQTVLAQVSKLAAIKRPVLILGERGTGKELIAERLHYLSERWDKQLIKTNCATLSESLLESELFGHEQGSFTGAVKMRRGRFELAEKGSLFLDEIGNTSMRLQEALLRVIEYGEFERVGGQKVLTSDVRLITATNKDLSSQVKQGKFRPDLLDRLTFDVITLPPLRARDDDILLLANHYGTNMAKELNWPVFYGFSQQSQQYLSSYQWPGNIRELKNVIERSVYYWQNIEEPIGDIRFDPFESPYRLKETKAQGHGLIALYKQSSDFKSFIRDSEDEIISYAIEQAGNNQKKAAELLGISYHSLRAYLRRNT